MVIRSMAENIHSLPQGNVGYKINRVLSQIVRLTLS